VIRAFAFLDLCGSSGFLDTYGTLRTVREVTAARNEIRAVSARRGVRVARWLGDGAMLVGLQSGPVLSTAVELVSRLQSGPMPLRAGVAVSAVLLFDGDDYLGRGPNLAARLCDVAEPGETLADPDCLDERPDWMVSRYQRDLEVRGMGTFSVHALGLSDGILV
jgi:class 3 adenylate cyclase